MSNKADTRQLAFPDSCIATASHQLQLTSIKQVPNNIFSLLVSW